MTKKGKSSKSCGNKGIAGYMEGKPAAKAAFVKVGNTKYATGNKYGKGKK
jgi:hypothetical protein